MTAFAEKRSTLERQFTDIAWLADSGLPFDELQAQCAAREAHLTQEGASHAIIKAQTLAFVLDNAQIALDAADIFADKLNGRGIVAAQKNRWLAEVYDTMSDERAAVLRAMACGAYRANADFGHTSPNTAALLDCGFCGLLARLRAARDSHAVLTAEQSDFYTAGETVLAAIMRYVRRHAAALQAIDPVRARCLTHIADGKPQTLYEALQAIWLYFYVHEYIGDTRVRTLGRLDALLYPYYKAAIDNSTMTDENVRELFRYFLLKIWAAKVPFDLPFMLGGTDEHGNEVTNALSHIILDTYNELNIHSPKIHIRVSDKTPADFLRKALGIIRGGNSSLLFVNEATAIKALERVGITKADAENFILIGCYEPAVNGVEIGCTGCASVNMAKAVEFVFTDGEDYLTGAPLGLPDGEAPATYEAFLAAVKRQIAHLAHKAMDFMRLVEPHYYTANPDPLLSVMYTHCVQTGTDAYNRGAKYNNSSVNFACLASTVDSLLAVKELVYERQALSFAEMRTLLMNNWASSPALRQTALKLPYKYGNGDNASSALAKELAAFAAALVNSQPNGRGGVFKAGLYSIDHCFTYGEKTLATPDGRLTGEPLSKNLCAVTAMDKNGITALIRSATTIDLCDFPNGSVLDVVLHPTAVEGEDGLAAMLGLLNAYFLCGGLAMHGNVFDSRVLREAQQHPERYATLQVRLCGWNVFFADLTKAEQDAFIQQTEALR